MSQTSPEFLALQSAVAGRYSLERELGRGGMGVVFLARDVALDRLVAIKLLPPMLAERPEIRDRFVQEARTAAGLSHPNIIPIHAVETTGTLVFFVMGFVEGETLGDRVRRGGPLHTQDGMRLLQEVAWALAHAHAHGVIHRDIKPDNILIERASGRAMVGDFGIARAGRGEVATSGVVGTPQYMSPEQAAGGNVDGRADLYSWAVTAWLALAGRHPFEAKDLAGLLAQHAAAPVPSILEAAPHLPRALGEAIDRCLAKDPADRFADADSLAEAVRSARGSGNEVAPPIRAFLRDTESSSEEIGPYLLVGAGSLGVYWTLFRTDLFAGYVFLPLAAVMVGLAIGRVGQVFFAARTLVHQGYGLGHLRPALAAETERQLEEARHRRLARRGILRDTWGAVIIGIAKTALSYWLTTIDAPFFINFVGAAGLVLFPVFTIRRLWQDFRRGASMWVRVFRSRAGKFLFRIAGIGVPQAAALPAGGEATEVALGSAVEALFGRLGPEDRRRFHEIPALADRLQADAARLRRAVEAGSASSGRLHETVAALENLRLDLLRLHVGTASPADITAHLDEARRIGERIDAELAGRDEVRRLLGPQPTPTT